MRLEGYVCLICVQRICVRIFFFFFSSRRRHTRFDCDWSSDVCSSDLDDFRHLGILVRRHVGGKVVDDDDCHLVPFLCGFAPRSGTPLPYGTLGEGNVDTAWASRATAPRPTLRWWPQAHRLRCTRWMRCPVL